ncbi:hypothetical protein FA13DRAFT_1488466 [Coprinellus micaceus]|uniref:Uncharacterized protein n=1 Tax=Coprinellus micaceus TaxID=71717 RepID=A0A4Y7TLZ5_COPMI|nr:hypothetical protein FA13DRAFT_1488466 [Coprinellus micaceus]
MRHAIHSRPLKNCAPRKGRNMCFGYDGEVEATICPDRLASGFHTSPTGQGRGRMRQFPAKGFWLGERNLARLTLGSRLFAQSSISQGRLYVPLSILNVCLATRPPAHMSQAPTVEVPGREPGITHPTAMSPLEAELCGVESSAVRVSITSGLTNLSSPFMYSSCAHRPRLSAGSDKYPPANRPNATIGYSLTPLPPGFSGH